MKPTAAILIRWSGVAAMVAGLCYVVVGLYHPIETLASVTTTRWLIVHALASVMCLVGPLGMVGLYARQAKESGWLGLAGYLLLSNFFVLTAPFTFAETFVLPASAATAPTFVESFLGMFNGRPGPIDLGIFATVYSLSGVAYMLGGPLFGIATIRARILPRWAAALLAVGAAVSPRSFAPSGGAQSARDRARRAGAGVAGLRALVRAARTGRRVRTHPASAHVPPDRSRISPLAPHPNRLQPSRPRSRLGAPSSPIHPSHRRSLVGVARRPAADGPGGTKR